MKKKEFLLLCKKMELIFQSQFLKILGFDNDEIENLIENSNSLKRKIHGIYH